MENQVPIIPVSPTPTVTSTEEAEAALAGIGHNKPPQFEIVSGRSKDLIEAARTWLKTVTEIDSPELADKARDFLDQLTKDKTALDKARKADNKPHQDQIKANNEQYGTILPYIDTAAAAIKELLLPWLQKLAREKQEAERVAREKAEKLRLEAEEKAKAAEQANEQTLDNAVEADLAAKAAKAAEAEANKIARSSAGVQGDVSEKKKGLRHVWFAEITDETKFIAWLLAHPDEKAGDDFAKELERLANGLAKSTNASGKHRRIPGLKIDSRQEV